MRFSLRRTTEPDIAPSIGTQFDKPCRSELKHHYLTKYCPGTAIAVYVMTRDRYLILVRLV